MVFDNTDYSEYYRKKYRVRTIILREVFYNLFQGVMPRQPWKRTKSLTGPGAGGGGGGGGGGLISHIFHIRGSGISSYIANLSDQEK